MNESNSIAGQPRLSLVGGFPGAGKTSALLALAAFLARSGAPTAILVAASSGGSVDAARLRHAGLAVEEYPAGERLRPAAIAAAARKTRARHVLVEAPGTAFALGQTIGQLRGFPFEISPLTVLADLARAPRLLGLEAGGCGSENIRYLYRKQLEEASLILLNPGGTAPSREAAPLRETFRRAYPSATILAFGGTEGEFEAWSGRLEGGGNPPGEIELDTMRCAEAAAALGALNATVNFSSVKYFDGNKVLLELGSLIQSLLRQEAIEIAHLKMALASADTGELATAHATSAGTATELQNRQTEPAKLGRLILNLRAEGDPELLHSAVNRALLAVVDRSAELFARMEESFHFRPDTRPPETVAEVPVS